MFSRTADSSLIRNLSTCIPAYTDLSSELEQYQKTFEPPYSSRPATGFLLVSFSKVTRHLLALFPSTFLAESFPNNANDFARSIRKKIQRCRLRRLTTLFGAQDLKRIPNCRLPCRARAGDCSYCQKRGCRAQICHGIATSDSVQQVCEKA